MPAERGFCCCRKLEKNVRECTNTRQSPGSSLVIAQNTSKCPKFLILPPIEPLDFKSSQGPAKG